MPLSTSPRFHIFIYIKATKEISSTQNDSASKDILVTMSSIGRASFEFADRKSWGLLDGGNILYLFATHAGIEATIEVFED